MMEEKTVYVGLISVEERYKIDETCKQWHCSTNVYYSSGFTSTMSNTLPKAIAVSKVLSKMCTFFQLGNRIRGSLCTAKILPTLPIFVVMLSSQFLKGILEAF